MQSVVAWRLLIKASLRLALSLVTFFPPLKEKALSASLFPCDRDNTIFTIFHRTGYLHLLRQCFRSNTFPQYSSIFTTMISPFSFIFYRPLYWYGFQLDFPLICDMVNVNVPFQLPKQTLDGSNWPSSRTVLGLQTSCMFQDSVGHWQLLL